MAWVRFDDGFFRHPKVVAAGRDARDMYMASVCYANQNLTDGFIPEGAVRIIAADAGVGSHSKSTKALVRESLWIETEGGYQIHDYLDYQQSAANVTASQAANRKRQEEWRNKNRNAPKTSKSESRNAQSNGVTNTVTNSPVTDTDKNIDINNSLFPDEKRERDGLEAKASEPPERAIPLSRIDPGRFEKRFAADPFLLVATMCDEQGVNADELSKRDRGAQTALAKKLMDDGATDAEIRGITRWLMSQSWVTSGVDMALIAKQRPKWILAGRPDKAESRAPTQIKPNRQYNAYTGDPEADQRELERQMREFAAESAPDLEVQARYGGGL